MQAIPKKGERICLILRSDPVSRVLHGLKNAPVVLSVYLACGKHKEINKERQTSSKTPSHPAPTEPVLATAAAATDQEQMGNITKSGPPTSAEISRDGDTGVGGTSAAAPAGVSMPPDQQW